MDLSGLTSAWENAGQATEQWLSGVGEDISDAAFNAWAIGEARTAAHLFVPVYQWGRGLSDLTSAMLQMYLNGNAADPNVIQKVAQEIALSAAFGRLQTHVRNEVNMRCFQLQRVLNQPELTTLAGSLINNQYRDPTTGKAMYFYNNDRGLQGVIGGIHNLGFSTVRVNGSSYTIDVTIRDRYDFNNTQNTANDPDLAAYVTFRNQLSDHIANRRYRQFLWDYHNSLYFADPIARARTFAAFMYAIEQNGLTPGGVTWTATIPLNGTMTTEPICVP